MFARSVAIALFWLMPLAAFAQAPASTFADLGARIKPGERVTIIGRQGEIRGTLQELSAEALTIAASDRATPRSFSADAVTTIRRADRLTNGMAIGGQIGAGLGVLALALGKGGIFRACSSDSGGRYYSCAAGIIAAVAGGGVAIGAGIDRSIEEVLYAETNTTARIRFVPTFASSRRGFAVAVRF